ncbi:putative metabotropic glutamate receptor 5 isoform X2 [Sesbania bispinosa]|nr:putative metabotropic glutamate receptor 5 isoform X2 [Sesbania bispinosa]
MGSNKELMHIPDIANKTIGEPIVSDYHKCSKNARLTIPPKQNGSEVNKRKPSSGQNGSEGSKRKASSGVVRAYLIQLLQKFGGEKFGVVAKKREEDEGA